MKNLIIKKCKFCGKEFYVYPHREKTKFCSKECRYSYRKIDNNWANWNIGRKISKEHKNSVSKANKGKHNSPKTEFKKGEHLREKNPSWKGGIKKHSLGYISLYRPNHPYNLNKYVKRARLIMEKHLGRYLKPEEIVHHVNSIKDDDRIENLMLFKNHSEHIKFHKPKQPPKIVYPNKDIYCNCGCGEKIKIQYHHRWYGYPKYKHGHHRRKR